MSTTDALGRTIPDATTSADPSEWFARYSLSNPGIVEVASVTEANTVRAQYHAACTAAGIPPEPLYVWRTDVEQMYRDTGNGWEYLAGRQHGAIINFARPDVPENISTPPRSLHATSISQATPGWTMGSEARVIVPAPGAYTMSAVVNISGAASTLGRVWFQFVATNGAIGGRLSSGPNENNHSGSLTWWLPGGTHLHVQVYHQSGGTRNYTAEVQIYMVNSPF